MLKVISILNRLNPKTRFVLRICVYGLTAGLVTVAFQIGMNGLYQKGLVNLSFQATPIFVAGSLVIMAGTSMISGWLLYKFCPQAAGSGIPQMKVAFWKDFGYVPWRIVWVKFVAGILSIGGGSSLGREGPSVQMAGGTASQIAGLLGEPKQSRRLAASAGAAAGLAAAFNTPLAAVTFVLEEIIQDLNSRLLGSVLLASVIGALLVHAFLGKQPAFTLHALAAPTWRAYLLTPILAALAALVGLAFQKLTLGLRNYGKQILSIPRWLLPSVGASLAWVIAILVFLGTGHLGVFGLGYEDLSSGLNHHLPWTTAGIILVTKLLATVLCYGFGGCGGIFSPTLCLGGMTGVLMAGVCGLLFHLTDSDQTTLAVVGMSACLGAVVHAPITGILIVFEMTHEFSLIPTLMIGALVSQALAHRLASGSFYDCLLSQDHQAMEKIMPPRDLRSWQELPVSAIANFQPVIVPNLTSAVIQAVLRQHPFQSFPVEQDQKILGVLTRKEAERAIRDSESPLLEPAVTCSPSLSIGQLQNLIISSASNFVLVINPEKGSVIGLVTLHDLLRAEVASVKNM